MVPGSKEMWMKAVKYVFCVVFEGVLWEPFNSTK